MHIQQLIIDGFKSYAQRTVISGWDTEFNAITGLNGSGKSNILDAICFVLGISNLSQVRASSLQDLVYKQGQAGVTKASVTIVFDNEDKESSPPGYEEFDEITVTRQVVIGGRNKYLINGHNAQQNRVQNLFHSVSLNVNNPHFLIMQGHITKVLNMKAKEILGMIEEAAGTRMFQEKKAAAQTTINKKQNKVDEIQEVLDTKITPTLDKLRSERALYIQWTNNKTEIDCLTRLDVAYRYVKLMETLGASEEELQEMKDRIDELKATVLEIKEAQEKVEDTIAELEARKADEIKGLSAEEDKVTELSKLLVQYNAEFQHKQEATEAERANQEAISTQMEDIKKSMATKNTELEGKKEASTELDAEAAEKTAKVEELQRQLQAVSAGIAGDEGADTSFADQLNELGAKISAAETEISTAALQIKRTTADLKTAKPELKKAEKEYNKMAVKQEAAAAKVAELQAELEGLVYSEEAEAELVERKAAIEARVSELRETVDGLSAKLAGLTLSQDGFGDMDGVWGVVGSLLSVPDPATATAIEVTAGGKLFNIVVENDKVGSKVIKAARRRVTVIPLNKIRASIMEPERLAAAEALVGSDNVQLALSLIDYDDSVADAMNYVFGSTLIVPDLDTAKTVTFDRSVLRKSVTYDGDVMAPAGTMSGGSRPSNGAILTRMAELREAQAALDAAEAELDTVNTELNNLRKSAAAYKKLSSALELKRHEVELSSAAIRQSSVGQLVERAAELEATLAAAKETKTDAEARLKDYKASVKAVEKEAANFAKAQNARKTAIEESIASAKATAAECTKAAKLVRQEAGSLAAELEGLQAELEAAAEAFASAADAIATLAAEEEAARAKAAKTKAKFDEATAALDASSAGVRDCDAAIAAAGKEGAKLESTLNKTNLELKKKSHALARFEGERKDANGRRAALLKDHPWIETESQFFGQPGTDFDFSAKKPSVARARLAELEAAQAQLGKRINKKVMSMFERAEQEYADLTNKKRIVENDKAKIEAVIAELDERKNEALHATWSKVNSDFGSIFATLLPGTSAKLEPPEGGTVLDGLVVRVAFGDVWKESLTELSGGQRSLLALSLILSLLLFKPAPMYILDEIDAALDLSHTQNIGQIIRTHFSQSQFIIVSLKEGMFNNANVLFKTKFVDGVSTVKRTTPGRA